MFRLEARAREFMVMASLRVMQPVSVGKPIRPQQIYLSGAGSERAWSHGFETRNRTI